MDKPVRPQDLYPDPRTVAEIDARHRRGLRLPLRHHPQHRPQVAGHVREAVGGQPALRLLVDGRPRRQVVRHETPRRARLHDVTQPVEHLAQLVVALGRILPQQREIGRHQRPFFIGHVGRVGGAIEWHSPQSQTASSVHNTL